MGPQQVAMIVAGDTKLPEAMLKGCALLRADKTSKQHPLTPDCVSSVSAAQLVGPLFQGAALCLCALCRQRARPIGKLVFRLAQFSPFSSLGFLCYFYCFIAFARQSVSILQPTQCIGADRIAQIAALK